MLPDARIGIQSSSGIRLAENALYILQKRYLKKDEQGNVIETPEAMFRRVAGTVASAELLYSHDADVEHWCNEFYRIMANLEFLPNSPTLLNAGREPGQLSACFVLPVYDSLESIFEAVKDSALIHKGGGGTGFSFSRLRPKGDRVGSAGGIAGGPVSFISAFSIAADTVRQGGIRRGCNIATLNVDHPDVMKFIAAKDDPEALTNFYISVAVTNEFMEAVKSGADYNLVNPRTGRVAGKLNAGDAFNRIVAQTWKTGDPGIVFIDRMESDNPTPQLGRLEAVCGCGEQVLLPYESCNLGSINLARMLKHKNKAAVVDYPRLARTVTAAVRFLDNVIDVNRFPLPESESIIKKTRKMGLGVMGFADMLIQLGIPYDSEEALQAAVSVVQFINKEAHKASAVLAEERGAFPAFKGSIYDISGACLLRNASCTTIAPTGTLSIIAGCSSGIEPNFALVFVRHLIEGKQLLEVNPYFEAVAKGEGFYSEDLMKKLACGCQLSSLEEIPDSIKRLFVTALEMKGEWHVRMQAAFQKHTDNAVSKTVNLPGNATLEDIAGIYMMAYEAELKGITVYRDGSRGLQPLGTGQAGLELMRKRLSETPMNRLI
jgi:ribonucleoside-diphosphate reductase alpha chain